MSPMKRKLVLHQKAVGPFADSYLVVAAENTVDWRMGERLWKGDVQKIIDGHRLNPIEVVIKVI